MAFRAISLLSNFLFIYVPYVVTISITDKKLVYTIITATNLLGICSQCATHHRNECK